MPPNPEASMPPLPEIECLWIPMSGGGGGSVGDYTSDTCGGVLVDEEARYTCEGEVGGGGWGWLMDGITTDTSGLGGGLGRIRSMGRSLNGASSDACCGEWDDGYCPTEPWVGVESWWGTTPRTSSSKDDMDRLSSRNL